VREPEIRDEQIIVAAQQQVVLLDVPVDDAKLVQRLEPEDLK
jgi:hypothetical protein